MTTLLSQRRSARHSRGQATVEFALILPVALCTLCLLLDVTWLAIDQCVVNDAARAAARAVIVDSGNAQNVATSTTQRMLGESARTDVSEIGGLITVHVSRSHSLLTPVVGWVLPALRVHATSTMLAEPRNPMIGY